MLIFPQTYPPRLSPRGANRIINQLLLVSGKEEEEARWKIGQQPGWNGNWQQIFDIIANISKEFQRGNETNTDYVTKRVVRRLRGSKKCSTKILGHEFGAC